MCVLCVYTHTHTHHTRTHTHTSRHSYIHTYIYTYMHAYIHTYIHTYTHTHTHTHTHTNQAAPSVFDFVSAQPLPWRLWPSLIRGTPLTPHELAHELRPDPPLRRRLRFAEVLRSLPAIAATRYLGPARLCCAQERGLCPRIWP